MRTAAAVAALALLAGRLEGQDAIDLHTVTVHNSPADVADWPITIRLTGLTERPGASGGFSFESAPWPPAYWQAQAFPADHPSTGTFCAPDGSTDGCIQYTVWAVARVNGQWHAAGFIQMYIGKASTGAPMIAQFHKDWAYACDRWPELCQYIPQPGDTMGFFLTAGNARDERGVSSARERSNVVTIQLPPDDSGRWSFALPVPPPPVPVVPVPVVPVPPPPVVVAPEPGVPADLLEQMRRLVELEADTNAKVTAIHAEVRTFAEQFGSVMAFVGKYVAPAIGAWVLAVQTRGQAAPAPAK